MKSNFKEKYYETKIQKTHKFFLDLLLFAKISSCEDIFYIDLLNLLTGFSYDQVFSELDYRKTDNFGKIEQALMDIIENNDFSQTLNKKFDFFSQQTQIFYLKNHLRSFVEFVEKKLFEKKINLIAIIQKYNIYLDKMIIKVIA